MAIDRTGGSSSEHLLIPAGTGPSSSSGSGGGFTPPRVPPTAGDPEDEEEEGMLRMSFLEHLEELRNRIIRALMGFGVAFLVCILFCYQLWDFFRPPATDALRKIGADPDLYINEPMEGFSIIWVKVPMVFALFLGSPWVLYQVWAFIAPGLYEKEKKMAVPFVYIKVN